MDNKLHYFTQNAMRKHEAKEHVNVYERAAIGGYYESQLSLEDADKLYKLTDDTLPEKQAEVSAIRKRGLESFVNDLRMDIPIMWTRGLLFRNNVYKFINGVIEFT